MSTKREEKMKKNNVIILICAALALGVFAASMIPKSVKVSCIEFPEGMIYDFGIVDEGQLVEYKFPFYNSGNDILRINRVIPSCGCTTAMVENEILYPKQTSYVGVAYKARRVLQKEVLSVALLTNDPKKPVVKVRMEGYVEPEVFWYPQNVSIYCSNSNYAKNYDVQFIRRPSQQMKIKEVRTSSNKIQAKFMENEKGLLCRVSVTPDCPSGFNLEYVEAKIETKKGIQTVNIPVHLMIE
jgi:hypothetical protein